MLLIYLNLVLVGVVQLVALWSKNDAKTWKYTFTTMVRLCIGLEDPQDLIQDIRWNICKTTRSTVTHTEG